MMFTKCKNKYLIFFTIIIIVITTFLLKNILLIYAFNSGNMMLARVSVFIGADINIRGDMNYSVLHFAAAGNDLKFVKTLIDKGMDINITDSRKITPLMLALMESSSVDMIKFLINNGADIKSKDIYGRSIIFYAVDAGNIQNIFLLEEYINNWNDTNNGGKNVLFMVNRINYSKELIVFLKSKKINPYHRDKENHSFFDYSKRFLTESQYEEAVKLLTENISR